MKQLLITLLSLAFFGSALALPKVGDSLSTRTVSTQGGNVTKQIETTHQYISYDSAKDIFSVQVTKKSSDGSQSVVTRTASGDQLAKLAVRQNYKLISCLHNGGQYETLTLKSGQLVKTCKNTATYSDGRSVIFNEAEIPGWDLVRAHSSQTVNGVLHTTVGEVTFFTMDCPRCSAEF